MTELSFPEVARGRELGADEIARLVPELRVELLNAQFDLRRAATSVLVLVAGDDREGCHELIDRLHEWMDARQLDTEVLLERTEEDRRYPRFRRYWTALPRHGRTAIHFGAWVYDALHGRVVGKLKKKKLQRLLQRVRCFEKALADDGMLVVKFWVHSSKERLAKRIEKRAQHPDGWRSTALDQQFFEHHAALVTEGQGLVARTDAPHAPWIVLDGEDDARRDFTAARSLCDALQAHLGAPPAASPQAAPLAAAPPATNRLRELDLTLKLDEAEYDARLAAAQRRLSDLSIEASERGVPSVFVFEGSDAAGKGGAIRRMTRAMPASVYRVFPISAPTEEERAHPWLWRFWTRLEPAGHMSIFDRSWYGRVLVERVEGFADVAAWRRAYGEIREFEEQLLRSGAALAKFWLHIDAKEQLRRFEAREQTPYKKYKIGAEDYRNRARWDDYVVAADEMLARTHAADAPWVLVPANDKRHARVQVIEAVCARLEESLSRVR